MSSLIIFTIRCSRFRGPVAGGTSAIPARCGRDACGSWQARPTHKLTARFAKMALLNTLVSNNLSP
jgi:hypothetical protein